MPRSSKKFPLYTINRFVYSEDGVYAGDGLYRWWREYDVNQWDGKFDVITKAQLIERMGMCETLGISVYEKIDPVQEEPGYVYEYRISKDLE